MPGPFAVNTTPWAGTGKVGAARGSSRRHAPGTAWPPGARRIPRAAAETMSAETWAAARRGDELGRGVGGGAVGVDRGEVGPGIENAEIVDSGVLLGELEAGVHPTPGQFESAEAAPFLLRDVREPTGGVAQLVAVDDRRGHPGEDDEDHRIAPDPQTRRKLGGQQGHQHDAEVLVATRRRRRQGIGVERGQEPEAEQQDGRADQAGRKTTEDVEAPGHQDEGEDQERPSPVERAGVIGVGAEPDPGREAGAEALQHVDGRLGEVGERDERIGVVPPAGVPDQPDRRGDRDHVGAAPAVPAEGELDRGRRDERDPQVEEEQRGEQQSHGGEVADAIVPLEHEQGGDPARDAAEEGHLEREEEVVPGRAEEENGQDRRQCEPLADAPADVDEQHPDAGEEEQDGHHLERHGRLHAEDADERLVDQDRDGEQLLDEGVQDGAHAPRTAVEQEGPLVSPERQAAQPVEKQDSGEQHRRCRQQRSRPGGKLASAFAARCAGCAGGCAHGEYFREGSTCARCSCRRAAAQRVFSP